METKADDTFRECQATGDGDQRRRWHLADRRALPPQDRLIDSLDGGLGERAGGWGGQGGRPASIRGRNL